MQAHVFAAVIDNEQVNSSSPTGQQLRDVLAVALTSAVWQVGHVFATCCDEAAFVCMYLNRPYSPTRKRVDNNEHAVHDVSIFMPTNLLDANNCAQHETYMPSQAWLQLFLSFLIVDACVCSQS